MAGILDQDPTTPDESPQHEGAESAPLEQAEGQQGDQEGGSRTQEIRDKIMAGAPEEMKSDIDRLVTAGKRLMYDPKTHDLMIKQLQAMKGGSEADSLAQGIAGLMTLIRNESKGPFPFPAVMPAAVILLMEVIDFLAEANRLEPTDEIIGESVHQLSGYLMKKMGIGPKEIQMAKDEVAKGGLGQGGHPQPTPAPQGAPQGPPQGQQPGILGGGM